MSSTHPIQVPGPWSLVPLTGLARQVCRLAVGLIPLQGFCEELARQGVNLVLVSRRLDKLQTVATELQRQFGVQTRVVDIDFSTDGGDAQVRLEEATAGLEVGILVNNVGLSYSHPGNSPTPWNI